jgi:hypothetical protein
MVISDCFIDSLETLSDMKRHREVRRELEGWMEAVEMVRDYVESRLEDGRLREAVWFLRQSHGAFTGDDQP